MVKADDLVILEKEILPIVRSCGLDVFDFKVKYARGTAHLEVLVDYPDGGVRMEDCVSVNRKIAAAFEESGCYGEAYSVSVASPGLDRPLKDLRDFKRVPGQALEVYYRDDSGAILCAQGVMKEVGENRIVLKQKNGADMCISFDHIQRACVKI